jgi:hypothetical protein
MPAELTTRAAIATFFDRGEPLFHISTPEECDGLVRKVYSSDSIATEADWCELSAIAALGCQYDGTFLPTASRSRFIQRTSSNLYNMVSAQALQNTKCFASLSLGFALEKSTTARSFTCKFCFVVDFRLQYQLIDRVRFEPGSYASTKRTANTVSQFRKLDAMGDACTDISDCRMVSISPGYMNAVDIISLF